MIPKEEPTYVKRTKAPPMERSWSDLQALARRVIRAANLAVMTHAELDVLTPAANHSATPMRKESQ